MRQLKLVFSPHWDKLVSTVRLLHTLEFLLHPKVLFTEIIEVLKGGNNLTAQQGSVARAITAAVYSVTCCVKCT